MKNIFIITLVLLMSSCTVGRFIVWNFADVNDYKKFKNVNIKAQNGVNNYEYAKKQFTFTDNTYDKSKFDSFESFLENNKTSS